MSYPEINSDSQPETRIEITGQKMPTKIHSEDNGHIQLLMPPPPEVKNRCGGLRIGEMERDAMGPYGGVMQFLRERLVDNADIQIDPNEIN